MSNTATLSFSASGSALFSRAEVRALMQVEFERAARYAYPIACLVIQIDHLAQIRTIHGEESKEEVLLSMVELVKRATRAGDLLGYVVDDRLVALVPHTASAAGKAIAERLLTGARAMVFQLDDRTMRVSLSIGLSHNQDPGATNFATLERVAEEGARVADGSGGDRVVQTELDQLYEREGKLGVSHGLQELLGRAEAMGYRQRLEALVNEGADLQSAAGVVADEIIDRAVMDARSQWESELEEANRQIQEKIAGVADVEDAAAFKHEIQQLNRRIAKLTGSLEATELEIARLRRLKGVEDGVESIYRAVQGLDDSDARAEIKKELMSAIFKANMDLQGKRGLD